MVAELQPAVAVVDDDADFANNTARSLRREGLRTVVITDEHFNEVQDLVERILETGCSAAVIDHRLSPRNMASFEGAAVVAELYEREFPAVLLSGFLADDVDVSLRRWRDRTPCVVSREQAPLGTSLVAAIAECSRELRDGPNEDRRARRVLIRVVEVEGPHEAEIVVAVISARDPDMQIRFPISLIENQNLRKAVVDGDLPIRLFARVNVGTDDPADLFFKDFEPAPEPDLDALR